MSTHLRLPRDQNRKKATTIKSESLGIRKVLSHSIGQKHWINHFHVRSGNDSTKPCGLCTSV
jgi:cytidine deaminase